MYSKHLPYTILFLRKLENNCNELNTLTVLPFCFYSALMLYFQRRTLLFIQSAGAYYLIGNLYFVYFGPCEYFTVAELISVALKTKTSVKIYTRHNGSKQYNV